MNKEKKPKVKLSSEQAAQFRAKLDSSKASDSVFKEQHQQTGELPAYVFADIFNILPPGPAQMMLVYHPELIKALHTARFMERDAFQLLLTTIGELTTQRATHEHQKALRRRTMEYFSASAVNANIPVVSELSRAHVESWVKAPNSAGSEKGLSLLDINHNLFIDIVAQTMVGRPISEELKHELGWAFVEGVKPMMMPVGLQRTAAQYLPNSDLKATFQRTAAVVDAITDIIETGFKNYVTSGGKKAGIIDDHLEFYLERQFAKDGQGLESHLMVWQKVLQDAPDSMIANLLSSKELKQVFDATTRQAIGTISAGFETTATVASWFDIMAATHPEKFAKVHQDVSNVDDVSQMSLHEMALHLPNLYAFCAEVLLQYPPLGIQFRVALKDATVAFDGQEVSIPKGTLIFPDHNSSAAFSGPFNPDRHLAELQKYGRPETLHSRDKKRLEHHVTAHQAFEEGGLHNCAGKFLAMAELMVSGFWKAKLIQQPRIVSPEGVDPTQPMLGATNPPHRGIRLVVG